MNNVSKINKIIELQSVQIALLQVQTDIQERVNKIDTEIRKLKKELEEIKPL